MISNGVVNIKYNNLYTRHLLLECPRSQSFWKDFGFVPSPFSSSIASWFKKHCSSTSFIRNLPIRLLFVFECSTLWYWRNLRFFDPGKPCNPSRDCISLASEFFHLGPSHSQAVNREPCIISWKPPPKDFYKLNTDGASKPSQGLAGCGGVFRDDKGHWICGFARNIGCTSAIIAELWALRDDLELAIAKKFMPLIVELDALSVIELLNVDSCNHYCKPLLDDCRSLLRDLQAPKVQHVYRGGNQVANTMVAAGCSLSFGCISFFSLPPAGVDLVLLKDCNNSGTVRTF